MKRKIINALCCILVIVSAGCVTTPRVVIEPVYKGEGPRVSMKGEAEENAGYSLMAGGEYLYNGEFAKVENVIRRAIQQGSEDYKKYELKGMLYQRQNRLGPARDAYEKAIQLAAASGNDEAVKYLNIDLGRLYYEMGIFEKAAGFFHNGLEKNDNGLIDPAFVDFIGRIGTIKPYVISSVKKDTTITMKPYPVPQVEVSVNGQPPVVFIIDTGAEYNIISSDIAAKYNIKPIVRNGTTLFSPGVNPWVRADFAMIDHMTIGDITINNVPVAIIDSDKLTFKFLGIFTLFKIDGIIGLPLLKNFITSFDYKQSEFSLSAGTSLPVKHKKNFSPLYLVRDRLFTFVEIDGEKYSFLIDTGSTLNSITDEGLNTMNIRNSRKQFSAGGGVGTGLQTGISDEFILDSLVLGNYRLKNLLMEHIEINFDEPRLKKIKKRMKMKFDGIIGNDLLSRFNVTYDFKDMRMFLETYQ